MVPIRTQTQVNRLYSLHRMVPIRPDFFHEGGEDGRVRTYFVAEDEESGALIGHGDGIITALAFDDPERDRRLWTLAVDPQTRIQALARR
jgi:ribosomal protein S18 acetylase RimI-like enzyme